MEYRNPSSKQGSRRLADYEPYKVDVLENTKSFVLAGIPVLVLLIIGLHYIKVEYWEDEVFSVITCRSLYGLFHMFHMTENNMSLYSVILYFWMSMFGESEAATHALSLLFAVVAIIVFFQLVRNWLNKTNSFFATLLLAVSPLFTYYSVEDRSYSLLILSVIVSTLLFIKLLKKPGYRIAIFYGLSIGIGTYIHYFALILTGVHALMLTSKTLTKKYISLYILTALVGLIIISPLILFPPQSKTQVFWIVTPDLKDLWYVISALFGGGYMVILLALCTILILINGYWKRGAGQSFFPEKISIVWSFMPVLLIFAFSRIVTPIFEPLYFSWLTPGIALLICLLVGYTSNNKISRSVIWICMLGVFTLKSISLLNTKGAGFRESAEYLNTNVKDGETVLVYPYFWYLDMNFYLDKIRTPNPAARSIPMTSEPYQLGGGGLEPKPDFDFVQKMAKKGKVYFICTGYGNDISKTDKKQNRIYLTAIKAILSKELPAHQDFLFGEKSTSPVLIQVYDKQNQGKP